MNSGIKINKLKYSVDFEKINSIYDFWVIETSDKFFKYGAYTIDAPFLENAVKSVLFEGGKKFYVLMKTNSTNKSILKQVLSETEDANKISLSRVNCKEIPEHYFLQLLLNSIATKDNFMLRFNNLTGHLYCFHPEWIKRDTKTNTIWQIPCLEIKIMAECKIDLSVHTFSSELLRKKITFHKRKFEDYPKYTLSVKNTLRRKLKTDNDNPAYIMRQIDGRKNEISFLNIKDIGEFEKSKMGILASVIQEFNSTFEGQVQLDFCDAPEYISIDCKKKLVEENTKAVADFLCDKSIKIVDCIDDEYSKMFCKSICSLLKDKYGVEAKSGKRLSCDCLNIRVIHNASYYENKVDDPHQDKLDKYSVQHITFEDFFEDSKFAISTVVNELMIKDDLKNKQISLFNWSTLGFCDDVTFGASYKINEEVKYYFMTVHPDGSFYIEEQILDLFHMSSYNDCVEIFDSDKTVTGLVKYSDESIDVIRETDLFTIPEIFNLKAELESGNTYLRNKKKRNELLSSVIDIKLYEENDEKFYFVGTIGDGMQSKIETASIIRSIKSFNNMPVQFERLLPLMNISFVRNGRLTVYPFPFKYLREYVKREI